VLHALSILSGAIVFVVLLDHLGSRRVRTRVRRQATRLFAKAAPLPLIAENLLSSHNPAPLETVRLKLKGSRRLTPKSSWFPVEAKLFVAPNPLAGVYYADWTRAPFVSEKEIRWLDGDEAGQERRLFSFFRRTAKIGTGASLGWWVLHTPWFPALLLHPDLTVEAIKPQEWRLTWKTLDNWSVHLIADDSRQWSESVLYGLRQKKEEPFMRCHWTSYKEFGHWSIPTELITEQYDSDSWWQIGQTQLTDWVPNEEFKWW